MSKILLKWSPLTTSITGILLYLIIIFLIIISLFTDWYYIKSSPSIDSQSVQNSIQNPTPNPINNEPTQEKTGPGFPIRLKIPKIGVDATIEYVGLSSGGVVDTPKTPENVAWFNLSQRPGENGSAVITGHYGGKKSAFNNLYKLRKGDKIYIEDDKGITISFVVRENRRYNSEADAPYVFSSNDGKSHLNLITCEGDWDEVSKSYSTRLVVFTDKE